MIQNAVVTKLLEGGRAQVSVVRETACAGNCASCAGCSGDKRVSATCLNPVSANVGDHVRVAVNTAGFLGVAALVYLLPLLTFFLGYLLSGLLGLSEGLATLFSMCSLGAGLLITVLIHRKRKADMVTLEIVSIES